MKFSLLLSFYNYLFFLEHFFQILVFSRTVIIDVSLTLCCPDYRAESAILVTPKLSQPADATNPTYQPMSLANIRFPTVGCNPN